VFNRMRGSLNRARQDGTSNEEIRRGEYAEHLISTFDDLLERLGTSAIDLSVGAERSPAFCGRTVTLST